MKLHAIAAVWLVSVLASNLLADFPEFAICTEYDVRKNVDFDGDIVVWEDYRHGASNPEIYWVDLADPNLIQNRIEAAGKQLVPAVKGSTIVWQDDRVTANRDIYVFDIVSATTMNLADGIHQRNPDVSEDAIVCECWAGGVYNAAVWNAAANGYDLIAPYAASQLYPAVDGTYVVWEDYRGGTPQIYGVDLSVEPLTAAPLLTTTESQLRPAISGNIVVWEATTPESTTLTAYDIAAGTIIWTHALPAVAAYASICDGIIVWQQQGTGINDYDIRGYNLNTGAYFDVATGVADDRFPVISQRTVVWQRGQSDILGAVIPDTPIADELVVLEPNGGEMFLSGSRVQVTWAMARGETPDTVNVDCSYDNGVSWAPAASDVPFTESYQWDVAGDIDSRDCLVRVSAADNTQVADTSDWPFTIFQCSPELTADLSGDCFVGLEDVAILAAQWLTSGNPYE